MKNILSLKIKIFFVFTTIITMLLSLLNERFSIVLFICFLGLIFTVVIPMINKATMIRLKHLQSYTDGDIFSDTQENE